MSNLRKRAEETLKGNPEDLEQLSPDEIQRLIHELRVHQIELELQNEELQRLHLEAEESRNRYADLYDFAPVGYLTVSNKGLIEQANLTCASMLGIERTNLLKLSISGLIASENQDIYYLHRRRIFETKTPQPCELWMLRKDKTQLYAHLECTPVLNENGDVTRIRIAVTDVTERMQTEKQLRFQAQIIENSPSIAAYHDKDLNMVWANRAYQKSTGLSLEDIRGRKCYQVWNLSKPCRDCPVITAIETGESAAHELTPDNQDHWPETQGYWLSQAAPVRDEQGAVIGAIEFAIDITERKQAEEALKLSEAKYRNIFENAVEGIFQTTLQGRFLSANPSMARMLGYASPEELISSVTNIGEQLYVNPEDRSALMNILKEKGVMEGFELKQRRKDGSLFWALGNIRTVKDEGGNILHLEGTYEDITTRKLAEESLHQTMEKLRKSLAGTIQIVSMTVETRDPYTAGHQKRVSNLARIIGQDMGLSNDTVENIRMAGIVHDIGKISVPAEILSKPGKLSNIEFSLIKVHPKSGYDILKDAELPYPIAEIVLQHHERLDGSGYPQGLKSNQILLEAKILAVADVVEAIATHRPYRPAKGIDAALEEIEKNKGILYDEKVVDTCVNLFREKGFAFE